MPLVGPLVGCIIVKCNQTISNSWLSQYSCPVRGTVINLCVVYIIDENASGTSRRWSEVKVRRQSRQPPATDQFLPRRSATDAGDDCPATA